MTHAARAHPFVDHLGVVIEQMQPGGSRCTLHIAPHHFNTLGGVHGGVLFSMADTGMGAALVPTLQPDQSCATVEIKINYFKPVTEGEVVCTCRLVHRGRTMAHLEADLRVGEALVARATGTFAILQRKPVNTDAG